MRDSRRNKLEFRISTTTAALQPLAMTIDEIETELDINIHINNNNKLCNIITIPTTP